MSTTELVPSVSIANMVNQRAAVIQRLEQAAELVREAGRIAREANIGMPRVSVSTVVSRGHQYEQIIGEARLKAYSRTADPYEEEAKCRGDVSSAFRKGVDCVAWQYLMQESGLRSLMDATARKKWDEAIQSGDVPELTDPNIRSTFKMLHDSRGEMFERGVIAVFKELAWSYKTNLPQKFGKRIVLRFVRGSVTGGGTSLGFPSYQTCDKLDDLVRVMTVLDGKPEPDIRRAWYSKMHVQAKVGDPMPEDEYISLRSFRNGNGHVTFKRPDLVDQMNRIIAKHYPGALPAPK